MLIHKPLRFISSNKRETIKNFQITIKPVNAEHRTIPHKHKVVYLGAVIDYLLRLNEHIINQLNKASKAFKAYSRLFLNRHLHPIAKLIWYLLFIRPILTYAAPVWWNISASLMEHIRKFERSWIRTALHLYRNPDSHLFISNENIYNSAQISRIDNFIIKLTRDYYLRNKNHENPIIKSFG